MNDQIRIVLDPFADPKTDRCEVDPGVPGPLCDVCAAWGMIHPSGCMRPAGFPVKFDRVLTSETDPV